MPGRPAYSFLCQKIFNSSTNVVATRFAKVSPLPELNTLSLHVLCYPEPPSTIGLEICYKGRIESLD